MKYKGYLLAILSATFFASIGIFVKNGISKEFSPIDLIILQEIVTIIILFVICIIFYRKEIKLTRKMLIKLIILGGCSNTLIMVFNYESYKYVSIAIATVILFTYPTLVAIATIVIYKKRISLHIAIAIIGSFVGCLLVVNILSPSVFNTINIKGVVFAFLGAVSFAFFNMYAAKILEETKSFVVTFYNAIFTMAVLLIFNFKFISKLTDLNLNIITYAILLAVMSGIIPSVLFYEALKRIGSIPVSIIGTLEIPIAALFSFFIMKDSLSSVQVCGVIVSLISVILLKFERKKEL
jgi:drug/metabolite transporter (DMT)-like permease